MKTNKAGTIAGTVLSGLTASRVEPFKSFNAKTGDLDGDVTIGGTLGSFRLDDVAGALPTEQYSITVTGTGGAHRSEQLPLDNVTDLSIDTAQLVSSITATQWVEAATNPTADTIEAPWDRQPEGHGPPGRHHPRRLHGRRDYHGCHPHPPDAQRRGPGRQRRFATPATSPR